jgi:GH15 family glucan-1,4-alpha-glucosidase
LLRDATLTLLALMDAGFYDEAHSWREWLVRAVASSPERVQIMYGIAGERRLTELEVPSWLPGYEGSTPVRIGNAACSQLQLDVFGEVNDALYQARCKGLSASVSGWALQLELLSYLERIWTEPDAGEMRGDRQHFTYSKVMAWVAFDRAIKAAEQFGLEGPLDRWREVAAAIHADVCRRGYDRELGSFVQSYGSKQLDASLLLLLPIVGFLSPEDPRIRGTLQAVERRLLVDGLLMRYDTAVSPDGLPPGEGAFLACSFWLVDAYVLQNRWQDARRLFARLLELRNDVGLLSEEYDPRTRRLVGNFPQAFTHVAPNQQRVQPDASRRVGGRRSSARARGGRCFGDGLGRSVNGGRGGTMPYTRPAVIGGPRSTGSCKVGAVPLLPKAARKCSPHELRSCSKITWNST